MRHIAFRRSPITRRFMSRYISGSFSSCNLRWDWTSDARYKDWGYYTRMWSKVVRSHSYIHTRTYLLPLTRLVLFFFAISAYPLHTLCWM